MGYTYVLRVEEDLDRLDIPEPASSEITAAWVEQGGDGAVPAQMVPHIRAALLRGWLARHRAERLAELDAACRWAGDNLGWRPLLHDETVTAILEAEGRPSLHRAFYSESPDAWFDSSVARAAVAMVAAHERSSELKEAVREELDAFGRALDDLARYGLRFRFDFCP